MHTRYTHKIKCNFCGKFRVIDARLDAIHLYTGAFSKCRQVVMDSLILYNINRINDVYVNNAAAGLRQPCLLREACSKIQQIVR